MDKHGHFLDHLPLSTWIFTNLWSMQFRNKLTHIQRWKKAAFFTDLSILVTQKPFYVVYTRWFDACTRSNSVRCSCPQSLIKLSKFTPIWPTTSLISIGIPHHWWLVWHLQLRFVWPRERLTSFFSKIFYLTLMNQWSNWNEFHIGSKKKKNIANFNHYPRTFWGRKFVNKFL